jgi:MFS family permease
VLAFWSSGTLIGAAIGFTCGGMIAEHFGWRWAFYMVGIPGLICALLAWRLAEPARGASESAAAPLEHTVPVKNIRQTLAKLSTIRTYWVIIGAMVFSFFTVGGTSFWLPTYIVDSFKLTVGTAGLLSGVVLVVSGLAGTLIGGWLADTLQKRMPQGRLLVAAGSLLLGAPLVLIALFIHILWLFVLVFILAGITLNCCTGPLNAVVQDVIAPNMRSTAIGLALLLAHLLGDAAAPFAIGGLAGVSSLWLAMIVTAPTSLFIAGLVCLGGLPSVQNDMEQALLS